MSAMDHAAAHDRIEDLRLEPTRLAALAASSDAADVALREHLAGCPACSAELQGWERLQRQLAAALPGSAEAATEAVEPVELPPSLRAAVITAAREAERTTAPTSIVRARRPRRALAGWLGLAAAIGIVAGTALFALDQVNQRIGAEAAARGLSTAIAAVDRVLAAPDHHIIGLVNPAGLAAGSISWSSQDLVVLTTALEPAPQGKRYLCWLVEGDSDASLIGEMYFAGRTAWWIGSLDEWATFRIGPNTRFEVTLQDAETHRMSGPSVLFADLGS